MAAFSKLNKHISSRLLDVYFRVLSGFVRVKYSLLTYWRIYVLMMQQAIILFAVQALVLTLISMESVMVIWVVTDRVFTFDVPPYPNFWVTTGAGFLFWLINIVFLYFYLFNLCVINLHNQAKVMRTTFTIFLLCLRGCCFPYPVFNYCRLIACI